MTVTPFRVSAVASPSAWRCLGACIRYLAVPCYLTPDLPEPFPSFGYCALFCAPKRIGTALSGMPLMSWAPARWHKWWLVNRQRNVHVKSISQLINCCLQWNEKLFLKMEARSSASGWTNETKRHLQKTAWSSDETDSINMIIKEDIQNEVPLPLKCCDKCFWRTEESLRLKQTVPNKNRLRGNAGIIYIFFFMRRLDKIRRSTAYCTFFESDKEDKENSINVTDRLAPSTGCCF